MSNSVDFTAPAKTILEAINDAIAHGNKLGDGKDANVYRFEDAALKDYVVRIKKLPKERLDSLLKATTRLTPPQSMLQGADLTQALLVDNAQESEPALSILRFVPGRSLEQWLGALKTQDALIDHVAGNSDVDFKNPFVPLFEDAYRAAYAGLSLDTNIGNIMYDPHNGIMRLIDLGAERDASPSQKKALNAVRHFADEMRTVLGYEEKEIEAGTADAGKCKALIDTAIMHIEKTHGAITRPVFASVAQVSAATPRLRMSIPEGRALFDQVYAQACGGAQGASRG